MKSIYVVRVELDLYVAADDEAEAQAEARTAIREEPWEAMDVSVTPLSDRKLPADVSGSYPYGEMLGDRKGWTVDQWQAAQRQGAGKP